MKALALRTTAVSSSQIVDDDLQYWKTQLAVLPPPLDLPLDGVRSAVQSKQRGQRSYRFAKGNAAKVTSCAEQVNTIPEVVVLSCVALLMHRLTRQDHLILGVTAPNLSACTWLPIVSRSYSSLTLADLIGHVQESRDEARSHSSVTTKQIVGATNHVADVSRSGIAEVAFDFNTCELLLTDTHETSVLASMNADLAFDFLRYGDDLEVHVSFNSQLFEVETINRWVGHLEHLISQLDSAMECTVARMPLMDDEEARKLLVAWNDTGTSYPRGSSVVSVFSEVVAASPHAIALVSGDVRLSYAELNQRADALCHVLLLRGLMPGGRVALAIDRSVESVVAVIAVLKAGGTYVPIDPSYPNARITYIFEDTDAKLVLTSEAYLHKFISLNVPVLTLEAAAGIDTSASDHGLIRERSTEDLAYVIYTSGSTGQSKGVLVPDRGILRLVRNTNYADLNAQEVFLHLAPLSFDASTFEIWGALLNGAQLVIAGKECSDPDVLGKTIRTYGVTTLWLTAALFHLIVAEFLEILRPLHQLLAGGDALSLTHVNRVLEHLPELRLVNGYGPTENTTFSTFHTITADTLLPASVPIGRPISNSRVYILDAALQPCPVGVPGELCVGGDGLAYGYLNQPELTSQRFITIEIPHVGVERIYRTGDMVRYHSSGLIEFFGRIDNQVKIRGYRIELGEVESALESSELVSSAVVTVYEDPKLPGDKRLIAYVVRSAIAPVGDKELVEGTRQHLREMLPEYMQPAEFIVLTEIPMTVNGKVDRRSLPSPQFEIPTEYVGPRDDVERELAGIWAEVLGRKDVGIHDNFFHGGGYSLVIVRLFTRINRAFKSELPITAIFNAPTIAQLADVVRGRSSYSAIVPVQTQGSNPPLFLIHSYLLYGKLPAAIGENQPVYGLREIGTDGDLSIIDRAAKYVSEIRAVRAKGPYYLAGWCAAGPITVEVSRQLSEAGEEVGLTLLFDAIRPGYEGELAAQNRTMGRKTLSANPVLLKLLAHRSRLSQLSLREQLVYMRKQIGHKIWITRYNLLVKHWGLVESLSTKYGFKLPDFMHNVTYQTFAALKAYRAEPISTRITLVRARDEATLPNEKDDLGWDRLTSGGVDVIFAPGTHESMFLEPQLTETAAIVRSCIEGGSGPSQDQLEHLISVAS